MRQQLGVCGTARKPAAAAAWKRSRKGRSLKRKERLAASRTMAVWCAESTLWSDAGREVGGSGIRGEGGAKIPEF